MKHKRQMIIAALLIIVLIAAIPAAVRAATTIYMVDGSGGDDSSLLIVNGRPAIAYFHGAGDNDLRYVRATNDEGTAWGAPVTLDSSGATGYYTSMAIVNGNPAISYYDSTNGNLRYVRATDANGTTWGTSITVEASGDTGYYTSMAIVNGNPAISYNDYPDGNLRYVRATDANGTAWGLPITVDTSGHSCGQPSMVVINGNPAIGYHDFTNGDLMYVRATDASGSAWGAPVMVDSLGTTGLDPSMAVVNGNPAISYFDDSSDDLRYVRATDTSGTAWGAAVTLDAGGQIGHYPSLAVVDGNPAVSYFDNSNGDLKYVRATDASGAAWDTPFQVDGSSSHTGINPSLLSVNNHALIAYCDLTHTDLNAALIVSDTTPPIVSGDTIDAVYASGPSHFAVTFSETVLSDGSAQAANNTGNYLLFEAGSNHVFDTVDCAGGVDPLDTPVAIQSATYNAGSYTVELAFNSGAPLPAGSYRLLVCGTTSIYDLGGNELNGGADIPHDFTVNSPAPAPAAGRDPAFLPSTDFARGYAVVLPAQPADKAYTGTDMTLEIPSLAVELPITGVPRVDGQWDVSWLGDAAGYLEGSAFPTWKGNTVLSGHVWDATNHPGPFAELKSLRYTDRFSIHAFGQTYVYEVRENELIARRDVAAAFVHEEDDWVTLLTCESYNPITEDYAYRRMVRAVLVEVQESESR